MWKVVRKWDKISVEGGKGMGKLRMEGGEGMGENKRGRQ